jgi:hypothetical protein
MNSLLVGLSALALPSRAFRSRSACQALSAEQIADPKAGRGMSLALAAELSGYPGPHHVLELGEQLGLTDQQRVDVQRSFDQMTAEVVPIGEKLISQEAELDDYLHAGWSRRAVSTRQRQPSGLPRPSFARLT